MVHQWYSDNDYFYADSESESLTNEGENIGFPNWFFLKEYKSSLEILYFQFWIIFKVI